MLLKATGHWCEHKTIQWHHYVPGENWHIFTNIWIKIAQKMWIDLTLQASRLLTAEAPIAHLLDHLQRVLHEHVHVRQQLFLGPGHLLPARPSHSPHAARTPPRPTPSLGLSPQPPPEYLSVQHHWHTPQAATLPLHCIPQRPRSLWNTGPGARSRGFSATRLLFILT